MILDKELFRIIVYATVIITLLIVGLLAWYKTR